MDINMKGYLTKIKEMKTGMKRLSLRYGSKRRWFELEGRELRYYESAENATERKHECLRGFIDIFDIQSVRKISTSTPNTFQIVTKRKGSLSLIAESEDIRNKWIETLQLAMRLKRSTVSISQLLQTSISDDMHGNSSEEEFWENDSSPKTPVAEQHLYSAIGDVGSDDVFDGGERNEYDVESKPTKVKSHTYEQCDLPNTQNPTSLIGRCTADDDNSLSNGSNVTSLGAASNINTTETGVHRESGYETTELIDPADVDNDTEIGPAIGGRRIDDENKEEQFGEEAHEKVDDSQANEDGDKRAVDVLKDLLRRTVVSGIQEDFDIKEDGRNEDEENEEEEVSAMDKLRALLE